MSNASRNNLDTPATNNPGPTLRTTGSAAHRFLLRHIGGTLATTLIFVSTASVYSLLEAFH